MKMAKPVTIKRLNGYHDVFEAYYFEELDDANSALLATVVSRMIGESWCSFDNRSLIGLDCEWQPEGQAHHSLTRLSKTATLQLSSEKTCLVLRTLDLAPVNEIDEHESRSDGKYPFPRCVKELLESPLVLKVGVEISGDAVRLYHDFSVSCRGLIDLRTLLVQCVYPSSQIRVSVSEKYIDMKTTSPSGDNELILASSLLSVEEIPQESLELQFQPRELLNDLLLGRIGDSTVHGNMQFLNYVKTVCKANIGMMGFQCNVSLATLARTCLGVSLMKDDTSPQCSDWSVVDLSEQQLEYAATDAWAGARIASVLLRISVTALVTRFSGDVPWERRGEWENSAHVEGYPTTSTPATPFRVPVTPYIPSYNSPAAPSTVYDRSPPPPPPHNPISSVGFTKDYLEIYFQLLLRESVMSEIDFSVVDKKRSEKRMTHLHLVQRQLGSSDAVSLADTTKDATKMEKAKLKYLGIGEKHIKPCRVGTRKTRMYDNCRILAPDGSLLSTCSRKKIDWYLRKNLGHIVEGENELFNGREDEKDKKPEEDLQYKYGVALQLFFEPSGRAAETDTFENTAKDNVCVVCGAGTKFVRHAIVPHQYRHWFPRAMKSHLSHDVVLLCLDCHLKCTEINLEFTKELAIRFGAPLAGNCERYVINNDIKNIRSSCRLLLNHWPLREHETSKEGEERISVSSTESGAGSVGFESVTVPDSQEKHDHNSSMNSEICMATNGKHDLSAPGMNRHHRKKLSRKSSQLPASVIQKHAVAVLSHFKQAALTLELLKEGSELEVSEENPGWKSHGELVVEKIVELQRLSAKLYRSKNPPTALLSIATNRHYSAASSDSKLPALHAPAEYEPQEVQLAHILERHGLSASYDLADFVREWRQRFLDGMKPQHLPPMWAVDYRVTSEESKI